MGQSAQDHPDIHDPNAFVFYRYHPSLAAAVIFLAGFLLTTGFHILQAARKRTYYFIPLIIGGAFEFVGYIGRAMAHSNEYALGIYIMQTLLLLVAPALFAASIYMILGRLIVFTQGEAMSPIRARWLTKIFVCGDILSFLVQSAGGGLLSNAKSMKLGKNVILVGLFLQILFFGFFLICGGIFHHRIIRSPTPASLQNSWVKYMYALYTAGILILIRSVFRVIEFLQGNDGSIMTHEVFLYVFDGVLMLGVMVLFNVIHPGSIIGRKARAQGIQLEGGDSSYDGFVTDRKGAMARERTIRS